MGIGVELGGQITTVAHVFPITSKLTLCTPVPVVNVLLAPISFLEVFGLLTCISPETYVNNALPMVVQEPQELKPSSSGFWVIKVVESSQIVCFPSKVRPVSITPNGE